MMTPYQKHKRKWRKCRECNLCENRRTVVLVRGKLPCDVLFCGEAPGESEDVLGKPFIGPAGKLLDRIILEAWGAVLANAWNTNSGDSECITEPICPFRFAWTNLVACIPKEDGKKSTEPPKEAIKACSDRLREIIEIAKPKVIIAVGGLATKHLPKVTDSPITSIVHPAGIMRLDVSQRGLAVQRATVILSDVFEEL